MFENAMLAGSPKGKRVWTTCLGASGQVLLVAGLAVVPMLWPEALPPAVMTMLVPTAPRGEAPKPKPEEKPQVRVTATRKPVRMAKIGLVQPAVVPPTIQVVVDPPNTAVGNGADRGPGVTGAFGTGPETGIVGEIIRASTKIQRPTDTVAVIAVTPPALPPRVKEGGLVNSATLLYRVDPPYPPLARTAHVEGVVKLRGVIAVDGHIAELSLVSGHPLLAPAAVMAVRQWRYAPTKLNGVPVEVETTIDVTFRLSR